MDPVDLFGFSEAVIECLDFGAWSEFIERSLDEQFWFTDAQKKTEVEREHGNSQAHQGEYSRVGCAHLQADP